MRLFQSFTRVRWIAAMSFALACVPLLGACGSSSSGTEVGTGTTNAATVTTVERVADDLTLLVGVTPGWEAVIDPWRAAVGEQSDGQLRAVLDLAWQDAHKRQQVELDIVDAVANGDLDIGYVGSRAFNALGVSDFDGLTAPFLVDSYELQDAVLDSDMPARMLAKVESLGVSGLALVAGPLRYPLGVERPLLEPTDFAGITFHTWPSATNAATAAALGSTHVDMFGVERDDAIDAGTIDATENSLTWMYNNGRASYATIDAPLWPATGVLIANPDMLSRLSTDQRAALQQAIDEALPRRADLAETDATVIVELCTAGKRFDAASADDLAALRAAVAPVYTSLSADPATASYLDQIQSLKSTITAQPIDIPDGCSSAAATTGSAAVEGTDDPSVLDGSYRLEWTVDELVASGADESTARGNAGAYVLTFDDGTFDQTFDQSPGDHCPGTYAVSGDRVVMTSAATVADWDCGGDSVGVVIVDAAWELHGDQLILTDFVKSSVPDVTWWNAMFLGKPLVRTG